MERRPPKQVKPGSAVARRDLERLVAERTSDLARANDILEKVFSSIDILIAYLDRDLNFIRVNQAYAETVGHTPDSLVGRNCFALFPAAETEQIFRRVVKTGRPYYTYSKLSAFHHPRRGDTYWDWSLLPLKDGRGRVNGLILSLVDVTARVRAEEQVRAEQVFRSAIEESLAIGIVAADREGRHTYANPAFCEMVGLSARELTGATPPFPYWPPEDRERLEGLFRSTLADSYPREGFETRFVRRSGELFDAHLLVSPLRDSRGAPAGWVASVGDITRSKEDGEKLKESARNMRRLSYQLISVEEKERKRVARELHDGIGQTLSAVKFGIEGALAQLDAGLPPAKVRGLLKRSASLMAQAIGEVRAITYDLRPVVIDDLGIVAATRWLCREYGKMHRGIRVRTEIRLREEEVPSHLKIVLYRIIQEALNNVARHSGADRVRLSLKRSDNAIELLLEDNGHGFDSSTAIRGIGLYSMAERTELSGGRLEVSRGRKGGTVVRVIWRPLEISL